MVKDWRGRHGEVLFDGGSLGEASLDCHAAADSLSSPRSDWIQSDKRACTKCVSTLGKTDRLSTFHIPHPSFPRHCSTRPMAGSCHCRSGPRE